MNSSPSVKKVRAIIITTVLVAATNYAISNAESVSPSKTIIRKPSATYFAADAGSNPTGPRPVMFAADAGSNPTGPRPAGSN